MLSKNKLTSSHNAGEKKITLTFFLIYNYKVFVNETQVYSINI